jgi:membrane carboxypeptidase/penicillin-binding protein
LWLNIRGSETVERVRTITQQYIKNAYLSQDYYVTRKVKEGLIAVEIERKKKSKNEIIADYLNTVYSGNDPYGVEAAETYFNKPVEGLTVTESATLVGLLWSPRPSGKPRVSALPVRPRAQEDVRHRLHFKPGVEIPQKEEQEPQPAEGQTTAPNDAATTTGAVPRDATSTDVAPVHPDPSGVGALNAAVSSTAPSSARLASDAPR